MKLDIQPGHTTTLNTPPGAPRQVHRFEADAIHAVNAALLAGRPLLVCGEPGTGKSQLARAVAAELGCAFVSKTVDARTEPRDLLWSFDAIARLAEAQIQGHANPSGDLRDDLRVWNFIRPGALWWAFDWNSAQRQARTRKIPAPAQLDGGDPASGCVVLIDEIDKAESDVPNALLEALGNGGFTPEDAEEPVAMSEPLPLVIITSNRERSLPHAFVRRCLVLRLELPDGETELKDHLLRVGDAHFPDLAPDILGDCADAVITDRLAVREGPRPGQAEYLDLLRVLSKYADTEAAQREGLANMKSYILKKHENVR